MPPDNSAIAIRAAAAIKHDVETHDLTKRYGDIVALDGLNLKVRRGEIYGFVGRTAPARRRQCGCSSD